MKNRLVLLIYDPRKFINVLTELRKRKIPFYIPDSLNEIRLNDIVYTDNKRVAEELSKRGIKTFYDSSVEGMVLEKAILYLDNKESYNELTIGVDPGRKYVCVVLADGVLVDYNVCFSITEALNYISRVLLRYPSKNKILKIGGGVNGILFVKNIFREKSLKDIIIKHGVKVVVVSEDNSTPKILWRNPFIERILSVLTESTPYKKDLYAATVIALKQGIPVEIRSEGEHT